ncbi:aconitate hydratase AcnA [Desulfonema ishimotonii]|uniref:Aconitate hydratase n=1 Tax=Desulfonema ishimotonii TaxID=45657 RepID=A0A401FZQ1_9BACT|nr:aconitate hydratase AcnA [Desulfonema ishimotonii]GBC62438.1 aconitate hydratase AcnA [Desulfonema ishimotonii]
MERQAFVRQMNVSGQDYHILDIMKLEEDGIANISRLPFSIRILVENLLRKLDGHVVKEQDLLNVANWQKTYDAPVEIPHHPARVLMQDFTGVPAVVDLAAMRDAVKALGGDPRKVNPLIPVELVVDHSVQIDYYGTCDALRKNVAREYERNGERYALLKWAQKSFDNFRVVPPNSGICHQVNLEHLGRVVITETQDGQTFAYPDSLVGTDSHTTMINGVGVMGWGVGGIEAEAVMLGQPYFMSIPEVIGVRMTGALRPGVTATDLVLTVTQMLREYKVVEKFVEFFGPGMKQLSIPDRATIANMSPEYGATMGFFPVDEKTVDYLRLTDRAAQAEVVEACAKALGLFYTGTETPEYTDVLEIDLATVVPSLAGPARPQDRIVLSDLENHFDNLLRCGHERNTDIENISQFLDESGCVTSREPYCEPSGRRRFTINMNGKEVSVGDGSIVIASITSCTNTSNPFVLLGAALLAKNAVERGLSVPAHVKTSLAPGSRVVKDYLEDAGLMPWLEALGFHLAGFGCTTCIGNSGPLHPQIEQLIRDHDLTVASVLSGNRNFEARIHQSIKGNFLASPMLVVAFALAGRIDVNLVRRPLGLDPNGEPVYLEEIWPKNAEIEALVKAHVRPSFYQTEYARIFDGDEFWQELAVAESTTFAWDEASTYIRNPPYFEGFTPELGKPADIKNARPLLLLGDSVTTDHISPAGAIPAQYPAGRYLTGKGIREGDFNSYGSRRGNHEVMMRGTFGNIRIKNKLAGGKEGSFTRKFPEDEEMFIYEASEKYRADGTPLVVMGGREYGTGSSRDWAAKGSNLLGVRAVIAESYERIHRSNLVGMGVLPLQFKAGEGWESLGLDGSETLTITGLADMAPRKTLNVRAVRTDGTEMNFEVISRLNTDIDVAYFEHGGILPYVLRKLLKD